MRVWGGDPGGGVVRRWRNTPVAVVVEGAACMVAVSSCVSVCGCRRHRRSRTIRPHITTHQDTTWSGPRAWPLAPPAHFLWKCWLGIMLLCFTILKQPEPRRDDECLVLRGKGGKIEVRVYSSPPSSSSCASLSLAVCGATA